MKSIIKTGLALSSAAIILILAGCSNGQAPEKKKNMETYENAEIFSKGDPAPKEYFTGNAFIHSLVAKDKNNEFALGSVTFEPGARTIWHTHPKGQVLIITEGAGFYQEKGKPAQQIKKGDVVNIPENLEHWHGAGEATKMVHIAITNFKNDQNVVWLSPVTDQQYAAVNK